MPDLAAIREGLADNLKPLQGVQVSGYLLSKPTPPSIEVVPAQIDYDLAFQRGQDQWTLTVRAIVGMTTDKGAQRRLDLMLASSGSRSVKQLIEADSTLGGTVEDLRVTSCTGYRLFGREGAASLLGAEWTVEVFAVG